MFLFSIKDWLILLSALISSLSLFYWFLFPFSISLSLHCLTITKLIFFSAHFFSTSSLSLSVKHTHAPAACVRSSARQTAVCQCWGPSGCWGSLSWWGSCLRWGGSWWCWWRLWTTWPLSVCCLCSSSSSSGNRGAQGACIYVDWLGEKKEKRHREAINKSLCVCLFMYTHTVYCICVLCSTVSDSLTA